MRFNFEHRFNKIIAIIFYVEVVCFYGVCISTIKIKRFLLRKILSIVSMVN